jgi:NADPH-dependent ferric siderophore reductase
MIVAWRFFPVTVKRLEQLSPTFLRVTFTGDELNFFADNGFDQRIKLIVPIGGTLEHMPTEPGWHAIWRELPDHQRNPVRTYTVRAVRQHLSEVDVDMVVHPGGNGPACEWIASAAVGDAVYLLGPDSRFDGPHGGIDFRLPAQTPAILLAGDETAVPAISSILERLPDSAQGEAILEVPYPADFLTLRAPAGVKVQWYARESAEHGSQLLPAVESAAERLLPQATGETVQDVDIDNQLLWEVPDEPGPGDTVYAWIAAEAGVTKAIRRHLVTERGLDRRRVAFMGYWRLGKAESN